MTPINLSTGSALPYDVVSSSRSTNEPDVYVGTDEQGSSGNIDDYTEYDTDPSAFGGGDTDLDDAAAKYASAVAGAQPATTAQPALTSEVGATIDDLAALGVFTDDELMQIVEMDPTPEELGGLYAATIEYVNSPEYAQQAATDAIDPQTVADAEAAASAAAAAGASATAGADAGKPGWSDEWNTKFQSAFEKIGLDSQSRMLAIASIRQQGLSESQLQQAFEYYTSSPEGRVELLQLDAQVREGKPNNARDTLTQFGIGGAILAGAYKLGTSSKNLERVLGRAANNMSLDKEMRTAAKAALKDIEAGTYVRGSERALDGAEAVRTAAKGRSPLLHPIERLRSNAAARNLTGGIDKITRAQAAEFGLGMRFSDGTDDIIAARNLVKGGGAVSSAAAETAAAQTTAKIGGTVAKAAGSAEVAAAQSTTKTLGAISKGAKFLGPVVAVGVSAVVGGISIKETMDAEGGFGKESAKVTGNVVGTTAGAAAGAAIGAALLGPTIIGAPIGAVVGGMAGGALGGWLGETVGGALHDMFAPKESPAESPAPAPAPAPAT